MLQHTTKPLLIALLLLSPLAALPGCDTSEQQAALPKETRTVPYFSLELRMKDKSGKATLYKIDRNGFMTFGGGRDAVLEQTNSVGFLTNAQLQQVLDLVTRDKLVETKDRPLRTSDTVTWKFVYKGPQGNVDVTSLDNEQPGLKNLHNLLQDLRSSYSHNVPYLQTLEDPSRPVK
jgi:hypothetical protein